MINELQIYNIKNYFDMNFHSHNSIEINYLACGEARYVISDNLVHMKKGNILVVDARIPHRLIIDNDNSELISIEIPVSVNNVFLSSDMKYKMIESDLLITMIIEEIAQSFYAVKEKDDNLYAVLYLLKLVSKSAKNTTVTEIKNYISNNYMNIGKIEDIASHFHISRVHIQRLFKKEAGMTIHKFLNQTKMHHAYYLLKNSNIPVGEIDTYIGMSSRQAFYNVFKKTYNISPYKVRKKH